MLPHGVVIRKGRVMSIELSFFKGWKGIKGIQAKGKKGLTTDFVQAFGYFLDEKKVILNKEEASSFCRGETFKARWDKGFYVAMYRGAVLGSLNVNKKRAVPYLDKKRARHVFNL